MLGSLGVPQKRIIESGEFQLRPGKREGQLIATLRDRTTPHIGRVLRPGKFTVFAMRGGTQADTGVIAEGAWAINHAHAAHKALRLERKQSRHTQDGSNDGTVTHVDFLNRKRI
jgi:hypothetical protein